MMINEVEISPEIVRLAQYRTRTMGVTLADELARSIVQESIFSVDPERGLLVYDDNTFSQEDCLVSAFGVNDIVINGCRFDVRTLDEDGRVAVSRALITPGYIGAGTLVVRLQGNLNGKVVAFIPASDWNAIDNNAGDQQTIYIKPKVAAEFDLAATVENAVASTKATVPSSNYVPQTFELATFVANKGELIMAKQRQLVEATLSKPELWPQLSKVISVWSKGAMRRVLRQGATWNERVVKITNLLAPRFNRLSSDDIKRIVARIGETFGGQPESPEFRKTLLVTLTREELSHNLGGAVLKKATMVAEEVLGGRSVGEVIKDFAKNRVAVDLATQIKRKRDKVSGFMEATTEELSAAFKQLSLQPVYATHSSDPQAGIETINEVLKMLEAGDLAESIKSMEADLINM